MAETISIQVPDGASVRIVQAICANFGYAENKLAGETQASFARRYTRLWWRDQVLGVKVKDSEAAIRNDLTDPLVTDTVT